MNLSRPEVLQFRKLLSTVITSPWHKSTKKSKQTMKRLKQIFRRLFAHQSSKCGQTARNRAENSPRRQEKPPGIPPDDRLKPEDLRRDALAMAREWQAEIQRWTETLKRHAT